MRLQAPALPDGFLFSHTDARRRLPLHCLFARGAEWPLAPAITMRPTRRRASGLISNGLLVGFHYTYGKNMSNNDESPGVGAITAGSPQIPQNFNDYRSERGLSAFDRP